VRGITRATERFALVVLGQALAALQWLHANTILHRVSGGAQTHGHVIIAAQPAATPAPMRLGR
jgi:hypothetical protein